MNTRKLVKRLDTLCEGSKSKCVIFPSVHFTEREAEYLQYKGLGSIRSINFTSNGISVTDKGLFYKQDRHDARIDFWKRFFTDFFKGFVSGVLVTIVATIVLLRLGIGGQQPPL